MDTELLKQYKYMDTPGVKPQNTDKQQQAQSQRLYNQLFNFLSS